MANILPFNDTRKLPESAFLMILFLLRAERCDDYWCWYYRGGGWDGEIHQNTILSSHQSRPARPVSTELPPAGSDSARSPSPGWGETPTSPTSPARRWETATPQTSPASSLPGGWDEERSLHLQPGPGDQSSQGKDQSPPDLYRYCALIGGAQLSAITQASNFANRCCCMINCLCTERIYYRQTSVI